MKRGISFFTGFLRIILRIGFIRILRFADRLRLCAGLRFITRAFLRTTRAFLRLCAGFRLRLCAAFLRLCAAFLRLCAALLLRFEYAFRAVLRTIPFFVPFRLRFGAFFFRFGFETNSAPVARPRCFGFDLKIRAIFIFPH